MKRKMIYISVLIIFIALGAVLYFYKSQTSEITEVFRCPEDYQTEQERTQSLADLTAIYLKQYPNSTVEELLTYRYQFLMDNHCAKTLQNLQDNLPPGSGTTTADIIKDELDYYNATETPSNIP